MKKARKHHDEQMNNISRHFILFLALLFVVPTVLAGKNKLPGSNCSVTDNDKRKAEYIFVEAQNQKNKGNIDACFDLLNYAYGIDSTNTTIAYYLGYNLLTMRNATKETTARALDLMKRHFDKAPQDFYETSFYSEANMQVGNPQEALRASKKLAEIYPNKLEVKNQLAASYLRVSDFKSAIAVYDSIEAVTDKSLPVSIKKVGAFLALKDTASATAEMHSLLATAPRSAVFNIAMGNLFSQIDMPDSAFVYLDNAQHYEPDNGYTYLAKAQYYNTLGDSVNFDKQIYKALINENLDLDSKLNVLTDYIRQLFSKNDSTQRIDTLFKALVEQHPHEASIHELYSEYMVARKNYKGAAEQLGYTLDIDPTNAESWRKLMLVNMMAENFPAAIKAADKALEYNPDSLDLLQYIAPAYLQMKEYDKSIEVFNKALALVDSSDVELRSNLIGGIGDVYFARGDTAKAFSTYEESLKLNPGNAGILNNYAYFLAECDTLLDKAEHMAAIAVKASPDNSTFIDTYAWVYFKKHDYKMALLYIKSAIDKDTDHSADIIQHYGDILFMSGKPDEALEQWKKALEQSPADELLQRKVKNKTFFYK